MTTAKQPLTPLPGEEPDEEFTFAVATVERRTSTRRSSLFGLENRSTSASPPPKTSKSDYEQTLHTEAKQWNILIKQLMQNNAKNANQTHTITMDVLTVDQSSYIAAAPDFTHVQAEGQQFIGRATMYLQMMQYFEKRKQLLLERVMGELRMSSNCLVRQF